MVNLQRLQKSVLIVGSGIGGLSLAVRLLSQGYTVKVYEKEKRIGGKTNQLIHGPFTFDLTASILMNREIYEEVFAFANIDYHDYLDFMEVDPTYRCFFPDQIHYDFNRDLPSLIKNLESISTEDSIGYMKLLTDVYERYMIANNHFLQKSFEKPLDFFNPSSLFNSIKTKSFSSSYELISKYIKNEQLRDFLAYQALCVGISPFEGPSIYTLVPVVSQLYGLWHLKGGMYSYVKALEQIINRLGGEIITNFPVEEIIISDGRLLVLDRKTILLNMAIWLSVMQISLTQWTNLYTRKFIKVSILLII